MNLGNALFDLVNRGVAPKQLAIRLGDRFITIEELCRDDMDVTFLQDGKPVTELDIADVDMVDAKRIRDKLRASLESFIGNRGVSTNGAEVIRKSLPELISIVRSQRMAEEIDQNGHIEIVQEDKNE